MKTDLSTRYLLFGTRKIPYELSISTRKKLRIVVKPNLSVKVNAPHGQTDSAIEDAVQSKGSWIIRQLDELSEFLPLPIPQRYVSGETLVYLGRQYRIKVSKGDAIPAKLRGRFLHIFVPDPDNREKVRQSVDQWYRTRAVVVFRQALERILPVALRHGAQSPSLSIRKMRTRWGSCSASNRMTLNLYLVQAPVHCIDYVVMHEVCHTKEFNHSPKFYSFLTRCMPNWKMRREVLKSVLISF